MLKVVSSFIICPVWLYSPNLIINAEHRPSRHVQTTNILDPAQLISFFIMVTVKVVIFIRSCAYNDFTINKEFYKMLQRFSLLSHIPWVYTSIPTRVFKYPPLTVSSTFQGHQSSNKLVLILHYTCRQLPSTTNPSKHLLGLLQFLPFHE
jgi:hypothetical protein